ncbi:MAG: sigma 54-interacting transcriptional regulator [Polyangiaceae bacterium]
MNGLALWKAAVCRGQLRVRVEKRRLHIERIGKCPMLVDGKGVDRCSLSPGQSVLLKGQMLLHCTVRPRKLARPARAKMGSTHTFGGPDAHGIVGESPVAWDLRFQLAWAAAANEHTLFLGDSGSGKELCARAVHSVSSRAKGPFVARNAATIPAGIADAELFGNVKDYPNPGMAARPGLIGAANGGTLFLDELGELPQGLQANLLRVLDEDGEYHCLGETVARSSRFRLLGATNRGAEALKHDLAARLTLRVTVPGLNERREDIPMLVRHLMRRALVKSPDAVERFFSKSGAGGEPEPNVSAGFIEALMRRSYETNVRELRGLLWAAMSRSEGDAIERSYESASPVSDRVQEWLEHEEEDEESSQVEEPAASEPTEAEVRASLAEHDGNVQRTAAALGLSTRYVLYRLMKRYGIERP